MISTTPILVILGILAVAAGTVIPLLIFIPIYGFVAVCLVGLGVVSTKNRSSLSFCFIRIRHTIKQWVIRSLLCDTTNSQTFREAAEQELKLLSRKATSTTTEGEGSHFSINTGTSSTSPDSEIVWWTITKQRNDSKKLARIKLSQLCSVDTLLSILATLKQHCELNSPHLIWS